MMAYVGIFYGTTFKTATTPYTSTEWARALPGGAFEYSIMGEAAFDHLYNNNDAWATDANKLAIMSGCLKYLDPWGRSSASNTYDWSGKSWGGGWHPGPTQAGDPSMAANGATTVYGYRMTDRHMARFYGWCEAAAMSAALPCKGVFVDDCLAGRQHWNGADRGRMWGAVDGKAGYTSDAYNWNLTRMNTLTSRLDRLVQGNPSKLVLFNSGHSSSYTGLTVTDRQPIMWEGYQRWFERDYMKPLYREGDVIVLQGRFWTAATNTESWTTLAVGDQEVTLNPAMDGVSYEEIWRDALEDAEQFGLHIALGWHTRSEHATDGLDSGYSCLTDPATLE